MQRASNDTPETPEPLVTQIRDRLLEGLATEEQIAQAIGKHKRSVARWNLPAVWIGRTKYIVLAKAREKLLRNQKGGDLPAPRGSGRPAQRPSAKETTTTTRT